MLTVVGVIVAIMAIVISTVMDGNSFGALIGPSSLFLVVVGALGVTLAGFDIPDLKSAPKAMIVSFTGKLAEGDSIVTALMGFAEIARRDGVLALESSIADLDDEFLKAGLQQVVDGLDAEQVREVMEIELGALDARHQNNIAFWKGMGGNAPTMGMVGTVIGLINMLGNLSDPAQLGLGLSVALLTTLYGVIFANLVFLPIGGKLARLHAAEMEVKELAIDGVLALQSGASPRAIVERLEAFLPPDARQGLDGRSGKKAA